MSKEKTNRCKQIHMNTQKLLRCQLQFSIFRVQGIWGQRIEDLKVTARAHMSSLGKDDKMQWENKVKGSLCQGYLERDKQTLS